MESDAESDRIEGAGAEETATKSEKAKIRELIEAHSDRISLKTKSAKSKAWSSFKMVLLDRKSTDFVKCNNCSDIYTWTPVKGTNSLLRHVCTKDKTKATTSTQPITNLLPRSVSQSSKQALNRAMVVGLAVDMRPLGSANSLGFMKIAQSLVNFGSNNGQVDLKKTILDRTTLKRSVLPEVVKDVKQNLVDSLGSVAVPRKMSFTMDLWTDKHQSRTFLSLLAHYFDKKFDLKHALLGCEEFPDDFKGTENVRSECSRILRGFSTEDLTSKMLETGISVTDSGSNVTKVFKIRKPCQCHKVNNFLSKLFSPSNLSDKFPDLDETFQAIKKLVTFAKKTGINKDLPISLKQAVPTRWCSELTMIDSYIESAEAIKLKLEERNKLIRLDKIDFAVAQDFSKFMQPFSQCLKVLQTDKSPTVHLVALYFSALYDHIRVSNNDTELMKSIKLEAEPLFQQYIKVDEFYLAACLLNPASRTLKFTTKEKADEAKEFLKSLLVEIAEQVPETCATSERSTKKRREDEGGIAGLLDSEDEDDADLTGKNEVEIYLAVPIPSDMDKKHPNFVAEFWKRQTKFPKLRQVASWMLAIPASSASDERVFSATGFTLSPRRTSLAGSTLADMTFIHFNAE